MTEAAYSPEMDLSSLWNEIGDLGLQRYVDDLDTNGYTVVPPEIANPNGLAERMLEACLDIAERRNGERPDLERGRSVSKIDSPVEAPAGSLLVFHGNTWHGRVQSRGAGTQSQRPSSHGAVPSPGERGFHRQDPTGSA